MTDNLFECMKEMLKALPKEMQIASYESTLKKLDDNFYELTQDQHQKREEIQDILDELNEKD